MPNLSFEQFFLYQEAQRNRYPGLLLLTETKMARVLSPWTAPESALTLPAQGYRCHVADAWLAYFGLTPAWKSRALVTQGVRASLKVLFEHACSQGLRVALPEDVYPVYGPLAQAAGLPLSAISQYATLSPKGLEELLSSQPGEEGPSPDWVLVTSPCKPAGVTLSAEELVALRSWLAQDAKRRVIVDAVYEFEPRIASGVFDLMLGGQLIYLHSLSKGWAAPLKAGVMLVPQQDVEALTDHVRSLGVDKAGLRLAQGLLESDPLRPRELVGLLLKARHTLRQTLESKGLHVGVLEGLSDERALPGQYLFTLPASVEALVDQHGVLALPASVFGSSRDDLAVVSSLSFVC